MIPAPLLTAIFNSFSWISLILDFAGLVICLRYLRLSTAMPLLIFAFAGFLGAQFATLLIVLGIQLNLLPEEFQELVALVTNAIHVVGTGSLVLGLWLVFRDMRERFQFLREAYESTNERSSPASGPPVVGPARKGRPTNEPIAISRTSGT